ncbi:MAG: hypothetical protein E7173_01865 [Firmicutes bacterium]|nr:hypothetical protein [Bacillota bacterium]
MHNFYSIWHHRLFFIKKI